MFKIPFVREGARYGRTHGPEQLLAACQTIAALVFLEHFSDNCPAEAAAEGYAIRSRDTLLSVATMGVRCPCCVPEAPDEETSASAAELTRGAVANTAALTPLLRELVTVTQPGARKVLGDRDALNAITEALGRVPLAVLEAYGAKP